MANGRRGRFALELESESGRARSVRFGFAGLLLLVLVAGTAFGFLAIGLFDFPSWLSRSLQSREMEALLARRVQLGERLRLLAARFERLEQEVRKQEDRVQRIRRLYGLPELTSVPSGANPARTAAEPPKTIFVAAILHVAKLEDQIDERLSTTDSLLVSLGRWESDHAREVSAIPAGIPIRSPEVVPTELFGPAREPFGAELEFHAGLDLAAPRGTAIVAPAAGVVRWAGEAPPSSGGPWWRLGTTLVLAHGDGFRTIFGHCDRILVRVGQRVDAGQAIATVGASGRTLSPKLHYEVRRRDSEGRWIAVDPASVLLDLDRLEDELGVSLRRGPALDATPAAPLPSAYAR